MKAKVLMATRAILRTLIFAAAAISPSGLTLADEPSSSIEMEVPFPEGSSSPSSTLLYCHLLARTELSGDKRVVASLSGGQIPFRSTYGEYLRLKFGATVVGVTTNLADRSRGIVFQGEDEYQIVNDDPSDFLAVLDLTRDRLILGFRAFTLNRLTGHLVATNQYASLYDDHPIATNSYYTCSSKAP